MEELIKEMEKLGYKLLKDSIHHHSFEIINDSYITRIYIYSGGCYKEKIDVINDNYEGAIINFEELEIIYKIMQILRGDK